MAAVWISPHDSSSVLAPPQKNIWRRNTHIHTYTNTWRHLDYMKRTGFTGILDLQWAFQLRVRVIMNCKKKKKNGAGDEGISARGSFKGPLTADQMAALSILFLRRIIIKMIYFQPSFFRIFSTFSWILVPLLSLTLCSSSDEYLMIYCFVCIVCQDESGQKIAFDGW